MNRHETFAVAAALLAAALIAPVAAGVEAARVPPDQSLAPREYEALGVPPISQDWTAEERSRARAVLRDIAARRPAQLPRFGSASSGALFAKLVREEFSRRDALEGPIGSVLAGEVAQMKDEEWAALAFAGSLEAVYSAESTGGLLFDREFVEFASVRVKNHIVNLKEMERIVAQMEASPILSQDAPPLREGCRLASRLLVERLGPLVAFAVAPEFSSLARADAVDNLKKLGPEIQPLLTAAARDDLIQLVRAARQSPLAGGQLDPLFDW